jgi:hypothetical protein
LIVEYCEGFLEIINTVEERIELESRLKVSILSTGGSMF